MREYPKIDEPIVNVESTYRGASADVIESQVTRPLEDSLSGIEGVDVMTSVLRSEVSNITLRFKLTRDIASVVTDVCDKVPLATASGAGAESRQQIGWVIVGGMLLGTLLTLFVVPAAYALMASRHKTFEQRLAEQNRSVQIAPIK